MLKARKLGCLAPVVYHVEHDAATIYMEEVQGRSVKAAISSGDLGNDGAPCCQPEIYAICDATDIMTMLASKLMLCRVPLLTPCLPT